MTVSGRIISGREQGIQSELYDPVSKYQSQTTKKFSRCEEKIW